MVRFVKINLSALLLAVALAATAGAAPLKDNGTGPDGIFIIPSKFAMRCDISSHDVHDDGKIEKCLNQILRMKLGSQTFSEGYDRFFTEAFHELNRDYIDVAIQRKAMAGDVADQMERR